MTDVVTVARDNVVNRDGRRQSQRRSSPLTAAEKLVENQRETRHFGENRILYEPNRAIPKVGEACPEVRPFDQLGPSHPEPNYVLDVIRQGDGRSVLGVPRLGCWLVPADASARTADATQGFRLATPHRILSPTYPAVAR